MAEEIYEEYIRKLLRHDDDMLHMTCNRDEFFRKAKAKVKDSRQAWKQQYYYRCLAVQLAQAFINVLEKGRNYVEAVDIYDAFPHFNFHIVFKKLCGFMAGVYKRGKCYTQLDANDYRQFIKFRDATKTADDLIGQWKQYLRKARGLQLPS